MKTIIQTKNFRIEKRSHKNNYYFVVFAGNNWNKFYNVYDAFKFCYKEKRREK